MQRGALRKARRALARARSPCSSSKVVERSPVSGMRAAIASAQASIEAGEAAVKTARIMLGYTTILSPVDGVIIGNSILPLANEGDGIYHIAGFDADRNAETVAASLLPLLLALRRARSTRRGQLLLHPRAPTRPRRARPWRRAGRPLPGRRLRRVPSHRSERSEGRPREPPRRDLPVRLLSSEKSIMINLAGSALPRERRHGR